MLRIIHSYDLKSGVGEQSFVEWLDARLDETTKRFGCLERRTWVYLDGIRGDYEKGKPEQRPKYLNEAFWPDQSHADQFRKWLLSDEGKQLREAWFGAIINHTVLRYMDFSPPRPATDD